MHSFRDSSLNLKTRFTLHTSQGLFPPPFSQSKIITYMHTPLAPLLLVPPTDMANKRFLTAACIYLILSFFQSSCDAASYNVVRFGARSNGRTDSSQAFQNAWKAACAASGSSNMVYIPRGTFMTKPVVFSGPCRSRILFQNDGTIVAPPNYQDMGNSGFWILFTKLSRLTVQGGTIDARGTQFWACRRTGSRCPAGVRVSTFVRLRFFW